ncbi:hypothetical protein REC12_15475 [Desulfosporosinus sp. PR]|uniref:hypothetical protein n=1 Tax=Candidatus Desulfosporosinus nitrosoreducens TaxID=3401928 RepID=UPI0027ED52FB|nr:hypothetical protein [Desulfosporosinus sp. PR]MDQ7094996.1 hypothetical protein [Desulfosporosinus sp. PR]
MPTGVFSGLTLSLGISMSDIFSGIGIFLSQFWPLIALGISIPVAFAIGGRLMRLGKRA